MELITLNKLNKNILLFSDNLSNVVHFVTPLLITSIANIIFFILTARHCIRVKQEINRMQSRNCEMAKKFEADKSKFMVTLKLFLVMGVAWSSEFISGIIHREKYFWYVADYINALYGIPIFIIFVLKRNVFELIKTKLGE